MSSKCPVTVDGGGSISRWMSVGPTGKKATARHGFCSLELDVVTSKEISRIRLLVYHADRVKQVSHKIGNCREYFRSNGSVRRRCVPIEPHGTVVRRALTEYCSFPIAALRMQDHAVCAYPLGHRRALLLLPHRSGNDIDVWI